MWEPEADITTSVVKVNLAQNDGKPISSDHPFQITFENSEEIVWQNASSNFSIIENNTLIFYHALNVSERDANGGAVVMEVALPKTTQFPIIFFKKGTHFLQVAKSICM